MRSFLIALAAFGAIAASSLSASALPVSKLKPDGVSNIEKVMDGERRRMLHKQRRYFDRYDDIDWDDYRYTRYRGWHHFDERPYRWRSRGCVALGPIWFCP